MTEKQLARADEIVEISGSRECLNYSKEDNVVNYWDSIAAENFAEDAYYTGAQELKDSVKNNRGGQSFTDSCNECYSACLNSLLLM